MSLPYFREWVDNWRSSPRVGQMTLEQRGAFHEMLCLSWQMGPLPNDPGKLAVLIGVNPEEFARAWSKPLTKCWRKTRKGLVNDRLELERSWALSRQKKARDSAKQRWDGTSADANADANAVRTDMRSQCDRIRADRNAIQNQIQSKSKDLTKRDSLNSKGSSLNEGLDPVPNKSVREEIPEGVSWHDQDGIQITKEWRKYLREYLGEYSKALDKIAPSSAGVFLTADEYQKTIENLNGRMLADTRLRPGPRSRAPKWKQFRALVRNEFVRALLRKREYHQKRSGRKGEPKSFEALRKSWEKLKHDE